MAKSTLLLDAHLKALRLPTFLREYDKVARHCAQEGLDLGLIRFGGHLPRGEYDVDHDGHAGQADAAELHG